MPRQRALLTLRQAALRARGITVLVYPERSLWRYAFAPPFGLASYTPLHLVNRTISRALEWCRVEEYTLYTCRELPALLREAVPGAHIERLPSQQRPYNLVALHVP
jgi:hypothetical protein